ncbi:hypothetical protein JCM8097_000466 [Rhodosporidiobolus ruineniae]
MIPPLPPELLLPIITASLPLSLAKETLKARYTTLQSLCLVSHTFRAVAQPMLFELVAPESEWGWTSFVRAVEKRPELGELVKRIWTGRFCEMNQFEFDVFPFLPNLSEIYSLRRWWEWPSCVQKDSPVLPRLVRAQLHLFERSYFPPPLDRSPTPFRTLRYILVTGTSAAHRADGSPGDFASVFPSLLGLAVSLDAFQWICDVQPHVPVLWHVTWQAFVDYMPPWRFFPSSLSGIAIKHLHLLPLAYSPPPHYLDELIRRVGDDPTLAKLEVLYLPKQWEGVGTKESRTEWASVRAEVGLEVEYEGVEGYQLEGGAGLLRAFEKRCEVEKVEAAAVESEV